MHTLCSMTKHSEFHGTAVEMDFAECPAQCLENWCYQPQELKRMSRHCDTGESIPDALIESIVAARTTMQALPNMMRLYYSLFDLRLHTMKGARLI
jgi:metallopeptidase MepB